MSEHQIEAVQASAALERGIRHSVPEITAPKKRILLFESEQETCSMVADSLDPDHFDVAHCHDLNDVSEQLTSARLFGGRGFDLLLWGLGTTVETSVEESLESLIELRAEEPHLRVVLLAPQEALIHALAIKSVGAEALILKPLHGQDIRIGVDRALRRPRLAEALKPVPVSRTELVTRAEPAPPLEDGRELGLIGASPEIRRVVALIRKVASSSVNVLITGESGTGKEMVASAIHRVSARAKKPFIAINCAAIPRDLLESELFGHAKGAFTGATAARRGLFEEANEGTILLDEIGDLPLPLQAKILRLLQTRQVKPLGQNASREVDVRVISATHKNLKTLIQKGEFREDLYYRLNVMPIHLPALRDRKEDILVLAEHFLRRYHESGRGPLRGLAKKAQAKLLNLPWKGNVRELENVIERAIVLSETEWINDTEIMSEEMEPVQVTAEDLFNSGMSLKDIEREYIKYVLSRTGNRKEAATRVLGIDRKTLYRKEKLYGIRPVSDMN